MGSKAETHSNADCTFKSRDPNCTFLIKFWEGEGERGSKGEVRKSSESQSHKEKSTKIWVIYFVKKEKKKRKKLHTEEKVFASL